MTVLVLLGAIVLIAILPKPRDPILGGIVLQTYGAVVFIAICVAAYKFGKGKLRARCSIELWNRERDGPLLAGMIPEG